MNDKRRERRPDDEQHAVDGREPVRRERHAPVDRGEGRGQEQEDQPERRHGAQARGAALVVLLVLLARPGAEPVGEHAPDHEVQDRAQREEAHVQVGALLAQERVGGDHLGVGPGVDRGGPDEDGDERQPHRRQRAGGRLVEPSRDETPEAARQVAEHREAEAAHADQHPEQVAVEIRAEELGAVRKQAGAERQQEDDRQAEAGPLQPFEDGAAGRAAHRWASPAACGLAATLSSRSARLPSGTSVAGAYWLSCSVRM